MNKLIFNIKEYFKNRKDRISFSGMSIEFDWIIILLWGVLIILVGLFYSIFIFRNISSEEIFNSALEATTTTESFDSKMNSITKTVNTLKTQ